MYTKPNNVFPIMVRHGQRSKGTQPAPSSSFTSDMLLELLNAVRVGTGALIRPYVDDTAKQQYALNYSIYTNVEEIVAVGGRPALMFNISMSRQTLTFLNEPTALPSLTLYQSITNYYEDIPFSGEINEYEFADWSYEIKDPTYSTLSRLTIKNFGELKGKVNVSDLSYAYAGSLMQMAAESAAGACYDNNGGQTKGGHPKFVDEVLGSLTVDGSKAFNTEWKRGAPYGYLGTLDLIISNTDELKTFIGNNFSQYPYETEIKYIKQY